MTCHPTNYQAFGAPAILLFFIDKVLGKGSYLDYGMFLQSIMLAAIENGLATCPQAALGEYPERSLVIRKTKCLFVGWRLAMKINLQLSIATVHRAKS